MSTPDEAVQAQLAQQAQASAPAPLPPLDLGAATATAVDTATLIARLEQLEAAQKQAADDHAAANPAPEPADTSLKADSNAPSWLHSVLEQIEARLQAGGL